MNNEPTKRRRGPGRPWPKGVSGNPNGRPRTGLALAEAVRTNAEPQEMVDRALTIMRGDNDQLALAAAAFLRDSGYQRPPQTLDMNVNANRDDEPDLTAATDDELQQLAELETKRRHILDAIASRPAQELVALPAGEGPPCEE